MYIEAWVVYHVVLCQVNSLLCDRAHVGDMRACEEAGIRYFEGRGEGQQLSRARDLLHKAALLGGAVSAAVFVC